MSNGCPKKIVIDLTQKYIYLATWISWTEIWNEDHLQIGGLQR